MAVAANSIKHIRITKSLFIGNLLRVKPSDIKGEMTLNGMARIVPSD
jgi:hypothetical protein